MSIDMGQCVGKLFMPSSYCLTYLCNHALYMQDSIQRMNSLSFRFQVFEANDPPRTEKKLKAKSARTVRECHMRIFMRE